MMPVKPQLFTIHTTPLKMSSAQSVTTDVLGVVVIFVPMLKTAGKQGSGREQNVVCWRTLGLI